jgi:hypothetical protein
MAFLILLNSVALICAFGLPTNKHH